nr:hypothetical protein [Tanacetum cinerariifolium]
PTARPTRGFRLVYGFVGTLDAEIRRDPDREIGYEITNVWEDPYKIAEETPTTDVVELNAEIRRDPDREIGYEITNVWEDPYKIAEETPTTDVVELSQRMTNFVTNVRQDTDEIYRRLDNAQDDRLLMSGQLNSLRRDRCSHAWTVRLMKSKARASREAWAQSMDASDTTRYEHYRVSRDLLGIQHIMMYWRRPVVVLRSGYVLAMLYTLLSITGNSRLKIEPKRTTRSSPTTTITTTTPMTDAQLKALIDQGVTDALTAHDTDRNQNGEDIHDSRTGVRRQAPLARECTYSDFMKCKPLYFKGTEGVFELTQWFERMEIVLCINNYTMENQIKLATCTLLGSALTWWNSHVKIVGHDVAYVKGTDVVSYNQRFHELALMCARMFPEESDKIERYVGGLPDMIHESTENKRKSEDTAKNNQNQQQQNKRQNPGRAYTAGFGEKKPYEGSKPLCSKCNYHHDGPCAPKCHKCNRAGHLARDCRSPTNANTANNQRGTVVGQKATCFEWEPKDISRGSVQS